MENKQQNLAKQGGIPTSGRERLEQARLEGRTMTLPLRRSNGTIWIEVEVVESAEHLRKKTGLEVGVFNKKPQANIGTKESGHEFDGSNKKPQSNFENE